MTLRHLVADVRLFIGFFLALFGLAMLFHGTQTAQWIFGSLLAAIGMASIFLVWLAATAGEEKD